MRNILFILLFCLTPLLAHSSFVEFGLSGSYRRSNLDENNFTETNSITASASYYFLAQSALELSFTKGLTTVRTNGSSVTEQTTKTEFQLIGLDFILSYGERESRFRPYLKMGMVYVDSKIIIQNSFSTTPDTIEPEAGIAPSAGIGAKILLSKHFSFRFGMDAWTSPLSQDPVEFNYAGRLGISWIF